ncbi:hypothetical protein BH10BDE1_BH10BDE1_02240 [soil metagenome]
MNASTLISCIAILLASNALIDGAAADTLARSFPLSNQVMITVYKPRFGGSDSDGQALYDAMNVPVQGSVMGPGKSIENATKSFSWVCGDRGADGHQCTIMIQKGAGTDIQSSPIGAKFEVTGAQADQLAQLVFPNTLERTFVFQNSENTLHFDVTPGHFKFAYEE